MLVTRRSIVSSQSSFGELRLSDEEAPTFALHSRFPVAGKTCRSPYEFRYFRVLLLALFEA